MNPKYPNIIVDLIGKNAHGLFIILSVSSALKKNGVPQSEINDFSMDASSSDFNHLLRVCMAWVNIN